jgi:peptide-methionine (S)-S-oxide reductase
MLATFGAGCFWGVEELFRNQSGVLKTAVGYEGGAMKNPTYEDVCADATGHAEVVQVEFDPAKISYEKLVDLFFANHNPTTVNRQGPDVGSQYRSVVFYHDEEQKKAALAAKEKWNAAGRWDKPVVTSIEPAQTFYVAEDYHQQYLAKRGLQSCHI